MSVATRDWLPTTPVAVHAPRHLLVPGPRRAPDDAPRLLLPVPRPPSDPVRRVPGVRHFPDTGVHALVAVPAVLRPELVAPEEVLVLPRARRPVGRLLGSLALDLLALAGLATSGLTAYAATHSLHPLVVRSGSMEPGVRTGSMVLVRDVPATSLQPGDVAAVKRPDGTTVTHRVVAVSREGALAQLVLKGDANKAQDADPVTAHTAGLLVWNVPAVGRAAAWTASAQGGFALGSVVGGVGALSLQRRSRGPRG